MISGGPTPPWTRAVCSGTRSVGRWGGARAVPWGRVLFCVVMTAQQVVGRTRGPWSSVENLAGVPSVQHQLVRAPAFPQPPAASAGPRCGLVSGPVVTSPRGPRVTQLACLLRHAWGDLWPWLDPSDAGLGHHSDCGPG